MPNIFCDLCHKIMDLKRPHYHEERGWVKTRQGGGTNGLALRQVTGRFAHWECVDLRKRNWVPDQESMF